MFRFVILLISTVLVAACATQPQPFPSTELDLFPERVELTVPGDSMRVWKRGVATRKDLSRFTTESVPAGQTLDDWSDIVLIDYWSHLQNRKSIETLAREYRQSLVETCPSLVYTMIERSSDSLLYEWSVEDCEGVDGQLEVGRFKRTKNGIHRVLYTHKGASLSGQEREQWRTALRTMEIRDIRPPDGMPVSIARHYIPHWQRKSEKASMPDTNSSANPNWIMNTRTRNLSTK